LLSRLEDLRRIANALSAAAALLLELRSNLATPEFKSGGDPVTAADLAVNELLFRMLPSDSDGWLSEESKDDSGRLIGIASGSLIPWMALGIYRRIPSVRISGSNRRQVALLPGGFQIQPQAKYFWARLKKQGVRTCSS